MSGKDINFVIGLILSLHTMITLLILAVDTIFVSTGHMNMTEYLKRWEEIVVNLVTPWWVSLLEWGVLGAIIFIVIILVFGKKVL